jgi:Mn2+/Fe2+ NRAMP family transporter
MSVVNNTSTSEKEIQFSISRMIGPGLLVAAAGIGAGDVVSATIAGANNGLILLWVVILAAFLKCVLNEGIGRYQLATGRTVLEGWAAELPSFVKTYFAIYLVLWTVSVSSALTNACGLGIENLTGGRIPRNWGAVVHSFIGFISVMLGGFKGFEKIMKALIGVMFFSMVACATLTFRNPAEFFAGFIPTFPTGTTASILSILGGIGGSVTVLAYNYWQREENMTGPGYVKYIRADIGIAYAFTAIFAMAVMVIANQSFHVPGTKITDSQAVTRMAETLGTIVGPVGFWVYSLGFWAAVFASLLGVWQSVPYLFADYWGVLKKYPSKVREQLTQTTSTPYRIALLYITLAPIPFAFVNQPLFIIRTYTIIGSLFIPFLGATLLYMNNRFSKESGVPRNGALNNALLVFSLLIFGIVGVREVLARFQ